MATSRKRVRYTMDVHFVDEEEKQAFLGRLKHVRELLKPSGSPLLDNFSLLSTLCASVEGDPDYSQPPCHYCNQELYEQQW